MLRNWEAARKKLKSFRCKWQVIWPVLLFTICFCSISLVDLTKYYVIHSSSRNGLCLEKRLFTSHEEVQEVTQDKPILTLFTSIKDIENRNHIHDNTLLNWVQLGSEVHPVLYHTNQEKNWMRKAANKGWSLRLAPKITENLPVLKDMFHDAYANFDSVFYGYSNSDILFTKELVKTLKHLANILPNLGWSDYVLLVGQRTNVEVPSGKMILSPEEVMKEANKSGSLFVSGAQDYFITTKNGFPWHNVPDFVIGRIAFDNWLMMKSVEWNITLIDMTNTVLAMHQTTEEGNFAGKTQTHKYMNTEMVGWYHYPTGHTLCSPLTTESSPDGKICLAKRTTHRDCIPSTWLTVKGYFFQSYNKIFPPSFKPTEGYY